MNTPLHATDEQLAELFDLLEKMEHDSNRDESVAEKDTAQN